MAHFLEFIFDFLLLHWKRKRQTESDWFGIVEKKKDKGLFSLGKNPCLVIFRTEDGSRNKIWMNEDEFSCYDLRKKYHKKQGDIMPDPQSGM